MNNYRICLPDQSAKIDLRDLDREAQRRLLYCAEHKINFISGTMSPADKDLATGELGPLQEDSIITRTKGLNMWCSSLNTWAPDAIYLFRDLERCYAASRNGYRISGIDLSSVYERRWRDSRLICRPKASR